MILDCSTVKAIKAARKIMLFRGGDLYLTLNIETEQQRKGLKEFLKEEVRHNGCTKIRFESRKRKYRELTVTEVKKGEQD